MNYRGRVLPDLVTHWVPERGTALHLAFARGNMEFAELVEMGANHQLPKQLLRFGLSRLFTLCRREEIMRRWEALSPGNKPPELEAW